MPAVNYNIPIDSSSANVGIDLDSLVVVTTLGDIEDGVVNPMISISEFRQTLDPIIPSFLCRRPPRFTITLRDPKKPKQKRMRKIKTRRRYLKLTFVTGYDKARPPRYLGKNPKINNRSGKPRYSIVKVPVDMLNYIPPIDYRRNIELRRRPDFVVPDGYTLKYMPDGSMKLSLVDRSILGRNLTSVPVWTRGLSLRLVKTKLKKPRVLAVNELNYFKVNFAETQFASKLLYRVHTTDDPDAIYDVYTSGSFRSNPYLSSYFEPSLLDSRDVIVDSATLLDSCTDQLSGLAKIAFSRKWTRMKNQRVDLGTELSQFAQAVSLFSEITTRLAETFNLLRKGQIASAVKHLIPLTRKKIANDHLAYQYGIKPLIADVFGAAEQLASYVLHEKPVKFNGHAKSVENDISNEILTDPDGHDIFNLIKETETSIRYKTCSFFRIFDPLTRRAAELGFTNPANTIWELVPFSFVIDWFYPIGNFLSSLSTLHGMSHFQSYETIFITKKVKYTLNLLEQDEWVDVSTSGNYDWDIHFPSGKEDFYSWTVSHTLCIRRFTNLEDGAPAPKFKNPISPYHIANAVALITQMRK